MADKDKEEVQPIIIVKRGGGGHDEHHGGVWKIAFADFMTAMMAFFLVMWLINASNEETRAQVASYFNPVKLTDAVAVPKGVRSTEPYVELEEHDEKNAEGGGGAKPKGGTGFEPEAADNPEAKEEAEETAERALFQDPYAVLVEIAGEKSPSAVPTAENGSMGQGAGLTGGEAFRDPFDPAFWLRPDDATQGEYEEPPASDTDPAMKALVERLPVDGEEPETQSSEMDKAAKEMAVKEMLASKQKTGAEKIAEAEQKPSQMTTEKTAAMPKTDAIKQSASDQMMAGSDDKKSPAKQDDTAKAAMKEAGEAELAAAKLKAEIMAATGTTDTNQKPVLSVDRTQEGLVVSLTDNLDFGMFASASARPNAEMVKFMDRIAAVLAKRQGRLVVRGHTDSRPFRSDAYDNWRLSTARAHMAYHMLVRGGVDTDRFARIEGYADRDPRNTSNTEAAENRRIEILLVEKP